MQSAERLDVPGTDRAVRTPLRSKLRILPGKRAHDLAAGRSAVVHPQLPVMDRHLPLMAACHAAPDNDSPAAILHVLRRPWTAIFRTYPFCSKFRICCSQTVLVCNLLCFKAPAHGAAIREIGVECLLWMMTIGALEMHEAVTRQRDCGRISCIVPGIHKSRHILDSHMAETSPQSIELIGDLPLRA